MPNPSVSAWWMRFTITSPRAPHFTRIISATGPPTSAIGARAMALISA